jgi:hypothetical protein
MVEKMINLALVGDFSMFHQMIDIFKNPFIENPENSLFRSPPEEFEIIANTFCGT